MVAGISRSMILLKTVFSAISRPFTLRLLAKLVQGDRLVDQHDGDAVDHRIKDGPVGTDQPAVQRPGGRLPSPVLQLPRGNGLVDAGQQIGIGRRQGSAGLWTNQDLQELLVDHGSVPSPVCPALGWGSRLAVGVTSSNPRQSRGLRDAHRRRVSQYSP